MQFDTNFRFAMIMLLW